MLVTDLNVSTSDQNPSEIVFPPCKSGKPSATVTNQSHMESEPRVRTAVPFRLVMDLVRVIFGMICRLPVSQ